LTVATLPSRSQSNKLCSSRSQNAYQNDGENLGIDMNLFYVKVYKAASTTSSGVVRRIAIRNGLNLACENIPEIVHRDEPFVLAYHVKLSDLKPQIENNLAKQVFLFTMIRDPVERCLSHFYYSQVTQRRPKGGKFVPTIRHKLQFAKIACNNFCAHFVEPTATAGETQIGAKEPRKNYNGLQLSEQKLALWGQLRRHQPIVVDQIISKYRFIGVAHRFEESMVLLAFQLRLTLCDILVLKTKDSRASAKNIYGQKMASHPDLRQEPEEVQRFFNSTAFLSANRHEYELMAAAEAKMDALIAMVEDAGFSRALRAYRVLLDKAQLACGAQAENYHDCLMDDHGCGQQCLDRVCAAENATALQRWGQ